MRQGAAPQLQTDAAKLEINILLMNLCLYGLTKLCRICDKVSSFHGSEDLVANGFGGFSPSLSPPLGLVGRKRCSVKMRCSKSAARLSQSCARLRIILLLAMARVNCLPPWH